MTRLFSRIKRKIGRFCSRFTRFRFPESLGGWNQGKAPVIDSSDDFFDPYCLADTDFLYVSNRTKNYISRFRIDTTSNKLVDETPTLRPSPSGWDSRINRACVLAVGDVYFCWYTGQSEGKSKIGLAKSKDGIHFDREPDPVIVAELPFEGGSVMNPCVLYYEGRFHMWYSAGEDYEPDVICYAESKDGITWEKAVAPVLTRGKDTYDKAKVGGCEVVKDGAEFHMFYIGYETTDNARVCEAFSSDGLKWRRGSNNPILSPKKHAWNDDAVYKPAFYRDSKNQRNVLFFNGRSGVRETIGVAFQDIRETKES